MNREIYLDNSATTKLFDQVADYIDHINRNIYGNPSSLHIKGIEAEKLVKQAREIISVSLGAESKEIIFTSGGTESNNLAIRGFLDANPRKGKHLITTQIEHPSVLEVYKHMEAKGYRVDYLEVDSTGSIRLEALEAKITSETALISIIYVNNEIGTVLPIEEIIKIKNRINSDTCLHVDAVQAYGKLKINPKKLGIDLLSISSHKIHGPKGAGALFAGKNIRLKPIMYGGGQEGLLRSGTENISGICGFGMAADLVGKNIENNYSRVSELKEFFVNKLKENIGKVKISSGHNSIPYILNVSFANIKSEVLLHHLEERNIFVSTGSACSSRKNVHSHVLKAIGLAACDIEGAIRFSFSQFNTEQDILDTVNALKDIIPKISFKR